MKRFMQSLKNVLFKKIFISIFCVVCLSLIFTKMHLKVKSTLLGYKLSDIKKSELLLLEEQSKLKTQLSNLTTKSQLEFLSELPDFKQSKKIKRSIVSN